MFCSNFEDDESDVSLDMSDLVTVGGSDDAGAGGVSDDDEAKLKLVSGHSGKRVPEERIDAESRGPVTHQTWLLSAVGPGYDETAEDDGSSEQPMMLNTSTAVPTTTGTDTDTCFNYHKLCDFWAKMGECLNNPFWMRPHCQLSCKSCGETLGDISTPPPRSGGCNNEHILCPFWAFIGECARNPRWMSLNCRATANWSAGGRAGVVAHLLFRHRHFRAFCFSSRSIPGFIIVLEVLRSQSRPLRLKYFETQVPTLHPRRGSSAPDDDWGCSARRPLTSSPSLPRWLPPQREPLLHHLPLHHHPRPLPTQFPQLQYSTIQVPPPAPLPLVPPSATTLGPTMGRRLSTQKRSTPQPPHSAMHLHHLMEQYNRAQ
uniref:ShKT domain-containing protein n=1 Tax=Globodera pallida TaxID=36090 RepID=A0A183BMJ0_GLOPA